MRSARSPWVEFEWNTALALGKKIIPCALDETTLPPSLRASNALPSDDIERIAASITVDHSTPVARKGNIIQRLSELKNPSPSEALISIRSLTIDGPLINTSQNFAGRDLNVVNITTSPAAVTSVMAGLATTPSGIFSVMILALSSVGYRFFGSSSDYVKVAMFLLMFSGYGLLGYTLIRRSRPSTNREPDSKLHEARYVLSESSEAGVKGPTTRGLVATGKPMRFYQMRLATLWFLFIGITIGLLALQTLFGKFGDDSLRAWGLIGPVILPMASVVVAALSYAPLMSRLGNRSGFLWAFWSSALYILLVLSSLFLEPFIQMSPLDWMLLWSLVLTPVQGLVIVTLILFLLSAKT
jgi:hypothetical protein